MSSSVLQLRISRRHLPHWSLAGSTYFVTFRLRAGRLTHQEVDLVKQHIVRGDARYYQLLAVQVMPDHVHLVLRPCQEFALSRVMKGIKGATARRLNVRRGTQGSLWQDEYFDRLLRDEAELHQKLNYMFMNSVKAGLTKNPWSYRGWYLNQQVQT